MITSFLFTEHPVNDAWNVYDAGPGYDDDRDDREDMSFDTVPETGDTVDTNGLFISYAPEGNADGGVSDEEEPDEEEYLSDRNEDDNTVLLTEEANHDFTAAGLPPEAQLEV